MVDGLVSLKGYTVFRKDRIGTKGGGVCIYLSDLILSNFYITPIQFDSCGFEGVFLTISNKTDRTYSGSSELLVELLVNK